MREGFVLRRAVFNTQECAAIAQAVEALVADLLTRQRRTKHPFGSYLFEVQRAASAVLKWEPGAPDVVQGVEPFAHLSEALAQVSEDPRLRDPSRDVVGQDDIALFTEKLTLKRARTGGPIVLHQDFPYWAPLTNIAHRIMTALIYLDDARRGNGALEVVPGSHTCGLHAGKAVEGFAMNEIDETQFAVEKLRVVEAPAGSVVFFGPFLVHRSLPNRSSQDRRALLYSYQPAGHPHSRALNQLLAPR